jgi:hypothetical protein
MQEKNTFYIMFSLLNQLRFELGRAILRDGAHNSNINGDSFEYFNGITPSLRYVYQWLSFTGFGRNPLLDIEDKYTDPVKVPVYLSEPVPVEIERV